MLRKLFHDHYCLDGHLGIDNWYFTLFEQYETNKQLKEKETFQQHWLKFFKTFYLYQHTPIYESQTFNYEGILAQFQFYQLFNYQFIQVCVFQIFAQALLLRFIVCFITQKYCYLLLSLLIIITIIFTIIYIITVLIVKYIMHQPSLL